MRIYTVVGGADGSGKTSFLGILSAERYDLGVIIDADKITASVGGNKLEGGRIAARKISECLEKNCSFTQETTLSGVKTLKTLKKARELGYYLRLYYIGISSQEESIERIKNRVRKGGHSIPENIVKMRYEKRNSDLMTVLPFFDEVHFFDNENGFTEIGQYKNGEIKSLGRYAPEWFANLL